MSSVLTPVSPDALLFLLNPLFLLPLNLEGRRNKESIRRVGKQAKSNVRKREAVFRIQDRALSMRLFLAAVVAAVLIAAGCQSGTETAGNAAPGDGSSAEAECSADSDCAKAGCSGQLCVQASEAAGIITTCEYKEEYGCLKLTSCGCDEGRCAWAATDEYETCLEKTKRQQQD